MLVGFTLKWSAKCTYVNYKIPFGIDNQDNGYLGMAVQLHVQAHLGHYHF